MIYSMKIKNKLLEKFKLYVNNSLIKINNKMNIIKKLLVQKII